MPVLDIVVGEHSRIGTKVYRIAHLVLIISFGLKINERGEYSRGSAAHDTRLD